MAKVLIGLGANLGDRQQTLQGAIELFTTSPDIELKAHSRWYETTPVGGPKDQPAYLNGAVVLETSLAPLALLDRLQEVEQQLGRRRDVHWGPRTLDLDLLLYDEQVVQEPRLVIPHPRMAYRRFVLEGAVEIAREMRHPQIGWTIGQLWEHLQSTRPYIAIAGGIGAGKTWLARELASQIGAKLLLEPLDDQRLATFYADPAEHGLQTEIDILHARQALLGKAKDFAADEVVISDFWFDQSWAFASVWLDAKRFGEFQAQWSLAQDKAIKPKLLAVLDAPVEKLLVQVQTRGREYEQDLDVGRLDQLRQAVADLARKPGVGPVVWLPAEDRQAALVELRAAIEAMK